jgi:hypothetical protein
MKVHIVLEDSCLTLQAVHDELIKILKEYPSFKEVPLDEADSLIIIPNYPMVGKQDFNSDLSNLILYDADHIAANSTFILDRDFSLLSLDEDRLDIVSEEIFFFETCQSIDDIYGFNPKQLEEFAKSLGEIVREQECSDWQNPDKFTTTQKIHGANIGEFLLDEHLPSIPNFSGSQFPKVKVVEKPVGELVTIYFPKRKKRLHLGAI